MSEDDTILSMYIGASVEHIDESLAHLGSDHPDDQIAYLLRLTKKLGERLEKLKHQSSAISFQLPVDLEHVEIEIIKFTIAHYKGDKKRAASALGVSLKTIYNKLEKDRK